jgi:hypothetical protein
MIDVKELRIGNYIYWDNPKKKNVVHTVRAVLEFSLHTTPLAICGIEDFSPIPLTEQWLIDFGFEKGNDIMGDCFYIEQNNNVNDFAIHLHDGKYTDILNDLYIDSVHQLQNLYFALTGKELVKQNTKL